MMNYALIAYVDFIPSFDLYNNIWLIILHKTFETQRE